MSWSVSCERFTLTAGPELRPPPRTNPSNLPPTKETCRKYPELNLDTIPIFKIASYLGIRMKLISYSTDLQGGQWILDYGTLSQNTIRMPRWSQLTVSLLSDAQLPCPHNFPSAPIFSPRRAVQPPCHLPILFFHMLNLLEHIPALLSLLFVVLPSSSSASHIPILLDLITFITYSSTLSPVRSGWPTSMPTHPVSSFRWPTSLFIHLLFSAFFSLSYRILLTNQLPPTNHIFSTFLPTLLDSLLFELPNLHALLRFLSLYFNLSLPAANP